MTADISAVGSEGILFCFFVESCISGVKDWIYRERVMGLQYTTKVDGDTMIVVTSGIDATLADVQNYAMEVLLECLKIGIRRVFCDETALGYQLGTFDTYELGKFFSSNVPAVMKVAIVHNPDFSSDARFYENVVVNRGGKLRMFTDADAAMSWLRGPDACS